MATQVQNRRGTTAEHSTFTGANGELTVDTTKRTLVVHDGATAGGRPLLREDQSNLPTSAPTTGIYNASGALAISTGGSGRLFVDANGNVGIAGSPANYVGYPNLRLNGTSGGILDFSTNGTSVFRLTGDTGGAFYYTQNTSYPHVWGQASSERMRLTSTGLGVGDSNPGALLSLKDGNVNDVSGSKLRMNLGPNPYWEIQANNGGTSATRKLEFFTSSGSGSVLTLLQSGSVGIGTTSPSTRLHVVGGASSGSVDNVAAFVGGVDSTAGCGARIYLSGTPSAPTGRAAYIQAVTLSTANEHALVFGTNAAFSDPQERARIDSSGRLLVGTSSTSASTTAIFQGSSGAGVIYCTSSSATPASGAFIGAINFGDSSHYASAQIAVQRDGGTWSVSSQPTRLTFSTTADGASSPTERFKINSEGILYSVPTYNNAQSLSANVFVFSDGSLGRATSSIKYKKDVETIEDHYADLLLNCRPVWYRAINSNQNPDWGYWGFIAEEVAEIDPRLVHWKTIEVTYDENGSAVETPLENPEPEGVQYDRFVPHLINLIKRQKEQIKAMEARLSALESA